MSRSSGYDLAAGMMSSRWVCVGACSESARETPGRSATKLLMRGTTPTVDTVTHRGLRPKVLESIIWRTAAVTAL